MHSTTNLHNLATAIGWLLLAILVIGLMLLGFWFLRGGRIAAVQSGSMQPSFSAGDALLLSPAATYQVGDIVRFPKPGQPNVTITHRLIGFAQSGWLITKGDANGQADQPIPAHVITGKVMSLAPGLGKIINLFHEPIILGIVVYVQAIILIGHEAWRLAAEQRAPYRLFGYR